MVTFISGWENLSSWSGCIFLRELQESVGPGSNIKLSLTFPSSEVGARSHETCPESGKEEEEGRRGLRSLWGGSMG